MKFPSIVPVSIDIYNEAPMRTCVHCGQILPSLTCFILPCWLWEDCLRFYVQSAVCSAHLFQTCQLSICYAYLTFFLFEVNPCEWVGVRLFTVIQLFLAIRLWKLQSSTMINLDLAESAKNFQSTVHTTNCIFKSNSPVIYFIRLHYFCLTSSRANA